jgi:hypothetical protein
MMHFLGQAIHNLCFVFQKVLQEISFEVGAVEINLQILGDNNNRFPLENRL